MAARASLHLPLPLVLALPLHLPLRRLASVMFWLRWPLSVRPVMDRG